MNSMWHTYTVTIKRVCCANVAFSVAYLYKAVKYAHRAMAMTMECVGVILYYPRSDTYSQTTAHTSAKLSRVNTNFYPCQLHLFDKLDYVSLRVHLHNHTHDIVRIPSCCWIMISRVIARKRGRVFSELMKVCSIGVKQSHWPSLARSLARIPRVRQTARCGGWRLLHGLKECRRRRRRR